MQGSYRRKTLSLSILIVFLTTSLPCQTEQWRSDGWLRQVRPDGLGNTYFLRGTPDTWSGPDTLFKVDPTGAHLWSKPLAASYSTIYVNGSGIYVISSYPSDSVYYFNTAGSLQWVYSHPTTHLTATGLSFDPLPLLAPNGDLILPVFNNLIWDGSLIVGRSGSLVKLASDGSVVFDVPIPDATGGPQPDQSFIRREYHGPYVDRTGNIWMSLDHSISVEATSASGVHTTRAEGMTEFLLFDGNTGALRFRKQVYKGLEEVSKSKPDGYYKSSNTLFPLFERFAVGDNLFIGYGYGFIQKESRSPTRGTKYSEQNFWFATGIDVQGNSSSFKFKGRGKEMNVDGYEVYKGDGSSNHLYNLWIGDDNALYLNGEISRGTMKNGVGELHYDYVILKMNTLKRKAWKKIFLDAQPTNTASTFFHTGEQKLMMSSPDQTRLTVIDQNGSVGTIPLSFPEVLWRFTRHKDAMIYSNTEEGVLHAAVSGTMDYGAKYSLPLMSFGPAATLEPFTTEENDESLGSRLHSNYPNPFNPRTTISFSLESDAVVTIKVYNSLGAEIAILADGEDYLVGENEVDFDGSNLSTGIYFYRLTAVSGEDNRPLVNTVGKMVIMK